MNVESMRALIPLPVLVPALLNDGKGEMSEFRRHGSPLNGNVYRGQERSRVACLYGSSGKCERQRRIRGNLVDIYV
jgi:hypothetical protein